GAGLGAVRRLGLTPVLWTAWGEDWIGRATPDSVYRTVVADLRGGGTVLLHDSDVTAVPGCWRASLGALPHLVATCRERGLVGGVVHLAARKSPAESVARPNWYHRENVGGVAALLDAMSGAGVRRLVFSSSAAVYGVPAGSVVNERTPAAPINPYGRTKLAGERLIRTAGGADGLSWLALRYFNVVGAAQPRLADRVPANLVPIVFAALAAGVPVTVTGADYPTRDGTGVRDYVHVLDVADAHAAAVRRLCTGPPTARVLNVGT